MKKKSDTSQCSQESEDLNSDSPEVIGLLNIQVKKRYWETPMEINQYLKDNKKDLTIQQITEKLNLPKTQVEHYFRTDKSRAIPSPQIWEQLKKILNLNNRYDKQVMEFYEKEMEYEMTRRVYNSQKIAPTLSSSNVLVSPKSTNTAVSSLHQNGQTSRTTETQQKLMQMNFQTLICCVEDFLARHSQLLERGKVSKIPEAHCFLRLQEYLKLKDLVLFSLRMSRAYSITAKGKLSKSSFKRFQNWGMKFNGWFLIANFSEFPRTGRGYSLSEILEEQADQKYYLSEEQTKKLISNMWGQ